MDIKKVLSHRWIKVFRIESELNIYPRTIRKGSYPGNREKDITELVLNEFKGMGFVPVGEQLSLHKDAPVEKVAVQAEEKVFEQTAYTIQKGVIKELTPKGYVTVDLSKYADDTVILIRK
jgi:hypothetical protein